MCAFAAISWAWYRNTVIASHAERAAYAAAALAGTIDPSQFSNSANPFRVAPDWYHNIIQGRLNQLITHMGEHITHVYIFFPHSDYEGVFLHYAEGIRENAAPYGLMGYMERIYIDEWGSHGQYAILAIESATLFYNTSPSDIRGYSNLIPGFAPIVSSYDGTTVLGLVGVDIDATDALRAAALYALIISIIGMLTALIIGFTIRWKISRALSYTLKRIVQADHTFGDESRSFIARIEDSGPGDDISILYSHFSDMFNTFETLTNDIDTMANDHIHGRYKTMIDESKYTGGHLRLITRINIMTAMYAEKFEELLMVIQSYSEGNFNVQTRTYEGDWEWANEVLRQVHDGFANVTDEIIKLAENASDGKFDVYANTTGMHGGWAKIMHSLNDLVKAVEAPLSSIENNVILMSKGDFSPMEGNYGGKFSVVQAACNNTNVNTRFLIKEIADVLGAIAEGDLTTSLTGQYSGEYAPVKKALETILHSLNLNMEEISSAASQVLVGSDALTKSSEQLSTDTYNQAITIRELHTAIGIIEEKTRRSADQAGDADNLARNSNQQAHVGNEKMQSMLNSMEEIKVSSANISRVIRVIEDIAFQSNLLALNAAVEASHAGKHGAGFSVVAEEVRSLALRSQGAVRETAGLIENSIASVQSGTDAATSTADSLDTIVDGVGRVSELISNISKISEEQASALAEISIGVENISQIVQSNAATGEECAAVAQEFNKQAQMLMDLVAFYKLR